MGRRKLLPRDGVKVEDVNRIVDGGDEVALFAVDERPTHLRPQRPGNDGARGEQTEQRTAGGLLSHQINATEPSSRNWVVRFHGLGGMLEKASSFNSTPQPGLFGIAR